MKTSQSSEKLKMRPFKFKKRFYRASIFWKLKETPFGQKQFFEKNRTVPKPVDFFPSIEKTLIRT